MIEKLKIKLFSILPKSIRKSFYKFSGKRDINGEKIYEGSIIRIVNYNSYVFGRLPILYEMVDENKYNNGVHCVEYYKGNFGSDIYSDFEDLSYYETIIVLGHVEEYRKFYNSKIGKFKIGKDSTGNFGSCIKFI